MRCLCLLLLFSPGLRCSMSKKTDTCSSNSFVMYRMVLYTEWSEDIFPKQYPEWRPPAQWSSVVCRTHNDSGVLWRIGQTVSDSVKLFVERGKADLLLREDKRGAFEFFAPPVLQGVGSTESTFFADAQHSKVSLISRIIPSPDWFIGVDSFELCRHGKWLDIVTLDLSPIDAGTDNGYTFTAPKWATEPRSQITWITSQDPNHPASSFFYPELDVLPRIGFVSFVKMKEFQLIKEFQIAKTQINERIGAVELRNKSLMTEKRISMNEVGKFSLQFDKKSNKRMLLDSGSNTFLPKLDMKKKHKILSKLYKKKSCRVSEWSEWGGCSNDCGFGKTVRQRRIIHFAKKNSRPCPPLEESKTCRSTENCKNKSTGLFRWQ